MFCVNKIAKKQILKQLLKSHRPIVLPPKKVTGQLSAGQLSAGQLSTGQLSVHRNDTTNTFISKSDLEKDHKITISDIIYNQIVSALAFQIKKFLKVKTDCFILKYMNIPNQCISDIGKVKSSHVNAYFSAKLYSTPISQNNWIEFYPFLEGFDWRHIYIEFLHVTISCLFGKLKTHLIVTIVVKLITWSTSFSIVQIHTISGIKSVPGL